MKDGRGDTIGGSYFRERNNIREAERLQLANKLRQAHISWEAQKMKVNLAAQVFCGRIEFCRDGQRNNSPTVYVIICNMQEAVEYDSKDIMMARRYQLTSQDDDMDLEEVPDLPNLSST
ncbi:THAP domain-containing protein 9 [Plakobranchus ocellatus]|uniref:THAP domain-containing protein 9 n=1 Tax=Plakobranchus ocellatus TaxID=259542 RepID=A0AAV4DC78_9GAST|nr:THAP domain-containing protein 9 [Plakobranchus ocellatus]